MREIFVENNRNSQTVISYIKQIFPSVKNSVLYKALRKKDIRKNDIKITKDCFVQNGDKLTIYIDDYLLYQYPKKLDVIYQDNHILAVCKPQGLLSNLENEVQSVKEKAKCGGREPTLESIVKEEYPKAQILHRLDRNTAGIVLFALSKEGYQEMLDAFENGYLKKEYLTYVANAHFEKKEETLIQYITIDRNNGYAVVHPKKKENSQKIITSYKVLKIDKEYGYAVLKVVIPTGKTHQIRAQMKAINHPIIGDSKYGKNEINHKFKKYKQMLFAYRYTFSFPESSLLAYLNDLEIKLDGNDYMKKLGE